MTGAFRPSCDIGAAAEGVWGSVSVLGLSGFLHALSMHARSLLCREMSREVQPCSLGIDGLRPDKTDFVDLVSR